MKTEAEYGGGILLKGLTHEQEKQIIADLTFTNPKYTAAIRGGVSEWGLRQIPQKVVLVDKIGNSLLVPRGYDYEKRFTPSVKTDSMTWSEAVFPPPILDLRDDQRGIANEFADHVSSLDDYTNRYLLDIPTAVGKTILGLHTARQFANKTLVIVPTTIICKGWFADAKKYLGLKTSDIGLIQGTNHSIGDQLTIAMAHTLERRKDDWVDLYSEFGTVIVDEPDQLVTRAGTFDFLRYCPASYMVGLTATTKIAGGRQFYLDSLFGQPCVKRGVDEVQGAMTISEIKVIRTTYHYRFKSGTVDWNELAPDMTCDEARNDLIIENVLDDLSKGETVLVNTKYLNHAHILKEILNERGVEDIVMITGSTNANKQKTHAALTAIDKGDCRCVIASTAIKVGANIPKLQNLHFACPYANERDIEQLIGRIRRKTEGKQTCNVRYYLDSAMPYMFNLYTKYAVPVFERHAGVSKRDTNKKQNDYKVKRLILK